MKRITKLIYLALGSCLIAGLNASCELVSENYGDINTSIFPKTAEDADAITTSAAYATFKNSGYGGLLQYSNRHTNRQRRSRRLRNVQLGLGPHQLCQLEHPQDIRFR